MHLYNTLSAEDRAILINDAGKQRLTLSFYKYAKILNPTQFRNELFLAWNKLEVLGRIYVANEGINAQLSLPAENFYTFKDSIEVYDFMKGIRLNIAVEHDDYSFLKLTVKVRDKIVADGLVDATFDVTNIGTHLKAKEFNNLLEDPSTIVVDLRNHYESEIGHFIGAIKPDVDSFRESLPIIENQLSAHKQDKKLLMYCTGGIRCEKASAYFRHKGFENVYQLEGGIIEYTRQVHAEGLESKFIGKNFVFDQRLGERITNDIISQCHQCGVPCDKHTNCHNDGCHLLFIQCDSCSAKTRGCCSEVCTNVIQLTKEEQREIRRDKKRNLENFIKGKSDALVYKNKKDSQTFVYSKIEKTIISKIPRIKKNCVGKGLHFYPKTSVAKFKITNDEIKIGDIIIIKGVTTGEQMMVLPKIFVNENEVKIASAGDTCTFKVAFRIRLSDKLYKVVE